jgi:hypothetical protein
MYRHGWRGRLNSETGSWRTASRVRQECGGQFTSLNLQVLELHIMQFFVHRARLQQLRVRTLSDHLPIIKNDDFVRMEDC